MTAALWIIIAHFGWPNLPGERFVLRQDGIPYDD